MEFYLHNLIEIYQNTKTKPKNCEWNSCGASQLEHDEKSLGQKNIYQNLWLIQWLKLLLLKYTFINV